MRQALFLTLLAACGFDHGKLPGSVIDAPRDDTPMGTIDAIDTPMMAGTVCLGTAPYELCFAQPTTPLALAGAIDTDTSSLCEATQPAMWMSASQPPSCFIVAASITVAGTASFSGSRPLVLFASDSITINGELDVSSHRDPVVIGPGAPSASCKAFVRAPANNSSGAAGGAGATFMSQGGDGGDGNATMTEGQSPSAEAAPTRLRAGCTGQRGGTGDAVPGEPGRGGGAVYIVAGGTLTISGLVNASGAGAASGGSGATKSGGSGGGSGGMIKLHAASINANGTLMANGGGGSSGADQNTAGNAGLDPASPNVRAAGGASVGNSGAGGGGFANGMPAQNGGVGTGNNTGGGGGGGGGGYIQSNLSLAAATISCGVIDDP